MELITATCKKGITKAAVRQCQQGLKIAGLYIMNTKVYLPEP
jgi:hypothetical protein